MRGKIFFLAGLLIILCCDLPGLRAEQAPKEDLTKTWPSLAFPTAFDGLLAMEAALGVPSGPLGDVAISGSRPTAGDGVGMAIYSGLMVADHFAALEAKDLSAAKQSMDWGDGRVPAPKDGPLEKNPPQWSEAFTEGSFREAALPGGEVARVVASMASWFQSLRHLTRRIPAEADPRLVSLLRNPAWASRAASALEVLPVEWKEDPRVILLSQSLSKAGPLVTCKINESLPAENLAALRELADHTVSGLLATTPAGGLSLPPPTGLPEISGLAQKLAVRYRAKGYAVGPTGDAGSMAPGQSVRFQVPVTRGLDYVFLVVTDRPGADFDISVRDDEGGLIMDDRRPDRFAGVQFRSGYSGTATVIVSLGSREGAADWVFLAGRRPAASPAWP